MLLQSTSEIHYPIVIRQLSKRVNDTVQRKDALFEYSYRTTVNEGDGFGNEVRVEKDLFGKYESAIEGTLRDWRVSNGTTITEPNTALVDIDEACSHGVQYGGMCVDCGKDLTTIDYTNAAPDTVRANTTVTPNHQALRISDEEAARSDQEAKQRLIDQRKLSLVVDLDLTIIHASVDPTIKEWMEDEKNPNHPAVADVRMFELYDEALNRNVSYYIKLRPNLDHFLRTISKLYELHIYTMGTRAYAENIARLVDPDRKLFGERILSRTETPGEVSKNLRKLFPVDNRMVVIIDDRADVWNWSNYLVRVMPFNFFVGIGDINSSFLPKQEEVPKTLSPQESEKTTSSSADASAKDEGSQHTLEDDVGPIALQRSPTSQSSELDSEAGQESGDESALGQIVSMTENNDASNLQSKTAEQDENIAAQLKDRPLLQLQKSLEKEQEEAAASIEGEEQAMNEPWDSGEGQERPAAVERARSASRPPVPQTLLKDNDEELYRIEATLVRIQNTFYNIFDERIEEGDYQSLGPSLIPDVKDVIERHRFLPLRGCRIVFSRIVPRHIDIMKTRWADMAMRLGAVVQGEVSYRSELREDTTHLICKHGDATDKMKEAASINVKKRARKEDKIHITSPEWLLESVSQWWRKMDEAPFAVHVEPPRRRRHSSMAADEDGFSDTVGRSGPPSETGNDETEPRAEDAEADREDEGDEEADRLKSAEEDEAEWADAFASDDDDEAFSDSDEEGQKPVPVSSRANGVRPGKKRRREDESDRGSESEGGSVASSQRSSSGKVKVAVYGSHLQKRKKRALERTSSLTKVSHAVPQQNADGQTNREPAGQEDEDDDGLEAAMREALGEAGIYDAPEEA